MQHDTRTSLLAVDLWCDRRLALGWLPCIIIGEAYITAQIVKLHTVLLWSVNVIEPWCVLSKINNSCVSVSHHVWCTSWCCVYSYLVFSLVYMCVPLYFNVSNILFIFHALTPLFELSIVATMIHLSFCTETMLGVFTKAVTPRGAGVPPFRLCFSLDHSLPHLLLFITFPFFSFLAHFTYFLLLSIRSLSTRIVPLRFQAWGRRRRPNLGLVCFVLWLCYLYCLVKIYSGILLYLV